MKDETKREFLEVVDRIADVRRQRHELHKRRDELGDKRRRIHDRLFLEINEATNGKGKPLYTNERARDAALRLKLAEHEEYQQLGERLQELYDEDTELDIQLERLEAQKWLLVAELGLVNPPPSTNIESGGLQ